MVAAEYNTGHTESGVLVRLVVAAAAVTVVSLLIAGHATGSIRMILNPRVVPRTIAGAAVLAAGAIYWAGTGVRARVLASGRAGVGGAAGAEGASDAGGLRGVRTDAESTASAESAKNAAQHEHSHHHPRSWRAAWPLLFPLLLLPAALRNTSADFAAIRLFTAGGSGLATAGIHGAAGAGAPGAAGFAAAPGAAGASGITPAPGTAGTPAANALPGAPPLGNGQPLLEPDSTTWIDGESDALLAASGAVYEEIEAAAIPSAPTGRAAEARLRAAEELAATAGTLVVDDDSFARTVDLVWDGPDRFLGREVEMTGFVYRRPEWPAETWVIARLSIWCCAADAAVVGFLAHSADARTAPPDGTWVRVHGTLQTRDSFVAGATVMAHAPEVASVTWDRIEAPRFEYVFPEVW
jgi:uncharacterized repeat protein (TIGR03943 family)